ncbi:hypothetical protein EGJ48_03695 [Pantoea dispersa]|uniref:hypothetical protein n=1 Tax=Pantoea dispersa TaxID=59814 RepID=UPI000F65C113|nr:hypothetical protein [Pantoea dispersa]RRW77660.1 hypothetical protein EGJ48_03695 [Pantoea dispersa]
MNNLPAMTEGQRQLAGLCKVEIKRWQAASESNPNMRYMVDLMEIALAALTAPPAPVLRVPVGWKLVPMEPTDEMIEAHLDEQILRGDETGILLENPSDCYRAMINAAPEASNEQ